MALAGTRESKDANGVVVVSNDVGHPAFGVGWIRFLETAFEPDGEFDLVLGKGPRPPIREETTIYLLRDGEIRCALPAKELKNTCFGWVVVFGAAEIRKTHGVTIRGNVLAERWFAMTGRKMPTPLWFQCWRAAWWRVEDESEPALQAWALAGASAEAALILRPLLERWSKMGFGSGAGGNGRVAPLPQQADQPHVSVAQRSNRRGKGEQAFAPSAGGISGTTASKAAATPGPAPQPEKKDGQGSLF